jgi:hypothetical protein
MNAEECLPPAAGGVNIIVVTMGGFVCNIFTAMRECPKAVARVSLYDIALAVRRFLVDEKNAFRILFPGFFIKHRFQPHGHWEFLRKSI